MNSVIWDQIVQLFIARMKVRYRDTFVGFLWTLIYPFALSVILYFVFSYIGRFSIDNYFIYLFSGLVLWRFFSGFTEESITAIPSSREVLRKTPLNRKVPILSLLLYHIVNHLIEYAILFIFVLWQNVISFGWVFLPLILIVEILFVLGVGLFLSAIYIFFTDIAHIWKLLLQLLFFASPIFYPIDLIPNKYLFYYKLNPIALLIYFQRNILLYGEMPDYKGLLYIVLWATLLFVCGWLLFGKLENAINKEL